VLDLDDLQELDIGILLRPRNHDAALRLHANGVQVIDDAGRDHDA